MFNNFTWIIMIFDWTFGILPFSTQMETISCQCIRADSFSFSLFVIKIVLNVHFDIKMDFDMYITVKNDFTFTQQLSLYMETKLRSLISEHINWFDNSQKFNDTKSMMTFFYGYLGMLICFDQITCYTTKICTNLVRVSEFFMLNF